MPGWVISWNSARRTSAGLMPMVRAMCQAIASPSRSASEATRMSAGESWPFSPRSFATTSFLAGS